MSMDCGAGAGAVEGEGMAEMTPMAIAEQRSPRDGQLRRLSCWRRKVFPPTF